MKKRGRAFMQIENLNNKNIKNSKTKKNIRKKLQQITKQKIIILKEKVDNIIEITS